MATILAKIASLTSILSSSSSSSSSSSLTNQSLSARSLYRLFAINLQRSFSSTSQTPATAPLASPSPASEKPKRKKKKKKNLFEVAQFLPNWGIGFHMAKSHWTNVSYELTKINLYKDGRHGKAWGIAYKDGSPVVDAPKKISGVHKRCWRYIPGLNKLKESDPNSPKSAETAEVQAA